VGGFKDFAAQLIGHLRDCYDVTPERVALDMDLPEGPVSEDRLMPLALSLNEMVSNAFKHAYPDGRSGRMKVGLLLSEAAGELLVKDDGAGLPSDFESAHFPGLGMKILRVFAGQLGGEVQVHGAPGHGAEFKLRFPSLI
jgi:two-component sensor histidine kinase